ncbi:MAG: hypothetical protein R8G66_06955 [Cytophagales bacterium]|nr:hypothetical protein [Cytophagales bacterium]
MDIQTSIVWGVVIYKVMSLLVGLASCYMGYRLFMNGVWGEAGDLNAQFGDNKLVLKKAAPGTFFAVLGTVVICFTLWKGLDIDQKENGARISTVEPPKKTADPKEKEEVLDQLPDELPE